MTSLISTSKDLPELKLRVAVTGTAFLVWAAGFSAQADEDPAHNPDNYKWANSMIAHAQKMRQYPEFGRGSQPTPPVIPRSLIDFDPSGRISTNVSNGPVLTARNSFFASLGTNDRTCFTCHQPKDAWSVSASNVRARFYASYGSDPLFRLVDGAVCPTADISTFEAKRHAYRLLLSKGLFRIALPVPANAEFSVVSVNDPNQCNNNPITGLTGPTSGIVSIYRRPLSSTNLGALATIMWDGREPSLASQAANATLGHAQSTSKPTPAQVAEIVDFESGLFTAQISDEKALALDGAGATGGPKSVELAITNFYVGVNDAFGGNPRRVPFNNLAFNLYKSWETIPLAGGVETARASVARGEMIFNAKMFNIVGVGGLNDLRGAPAVIPGFCTSCHDTPNIGNISLNFLANLGISASQDQALAPLEVEGLPTFTLRCNSGARAGNTYVVTDPGRALISGKCEDIAKFKSPMLRGLAGHAPYFHNGSAATLKDVVNFYNRRFGIGYSDQEIEDLTAFLKTL